MASFWKLIKTVTKEAHRDDIAGEAAKVAYFFFLSLFPAVLAIFALTGIFGGDASFETIMSYLRALLPGEAATYLQRFVQEITGQSRPGLLSLGIILTFWSASNIFTSLANGLNTMYDLKENRGWWKRRLLALVVLIAAAILLNAGVVSLLAGPTLISHFGLTGLLVFLRWPLVYLLITGFMWLTYYILPNRDQSRWKREVLIGAAVGSALWMGGSALFKLYISNLTNYSQTYGFVGAVIVLLLWLYMTALTILFGGEVAATLGQELKPYRKPEN